MFNVEKGLEPDQTLVCKLDKQGIIKFVNKAYVDITGFSEKDLIGESNEVIQHPKMPRIILNTAWESINKGNHIYFASKNITKNGEFFWTLAEIHSKINENKPTSIFVRRKYLPLDIKEELNKLYEVLYGIESSGGGSKVAQKYLNGWLEDKGGSIHNYIIDKFGGESKLKAYMTSEVSDKELFASDPNEMEIDEILKMLKKKKKRFWF